jgi:DNA-binding transcriptional regulator YhcF (GntR family)
MLKLEKATGIYLRQVLGEFSDDGVWEQANSLPFFLQDRYQFRRAVVAGKSCLWMLARDGIEDTPAVVRKHLGAVQQFYQGPVIYVVERTTSYNRKRLIEQRVPFVVPSKQMYLPMLGIDLRERFSDPVDQKDKPLGAVAQVLLLRELFDPGDSAASAGELARKLGYSAMTIGRAFTELTARNLAEVNRVGREKHLIFEQCGKTLWELVSQHLDSPVRKCTWIEYTVHDMPAPAAGETALAHYTMLAEPRNQVLAISAKEWSGQKELLHLRELPRGDEQALCVELWRYNPRLVKDSPYVDELSLWLSIRDSDDERVEMAADELLGAIQW